MEHALTFQREALKGDMNAQMACYGIGNNTSVKSSTVTGKCLNSNTKLNNYILHKTILN